jgi:hypothetical protein
VIFFSFITSCPARGDDPAVFATERADDDRFVAVDEAEDHVADFALAVGSPDNRRAINHLSRICEINLVVAQVDSTFTFVPLERSNAREQLPDNVLVFRHSNRPQRKG